MTADERSMDTVVLRFPAPNVPLSINEANRMHWARQRRRLEPWAEAAGWAWKIQGKASGMKDVPCSVRMVLPFKQARRRDASNYTGTVVKVVVDALVRQGVWRDDTPDLVTVLDSAIVRGTEAEVWLIPREEVADGHSHGLPQ